MTAISPTNQLRPYQLRPYQQEAVDAAVGHFRISKEPACLVLPTGAGKSLIIAELCRLAKGRVLVLAHVKELCEQNYNKYRSLAAPSSGSKAGLFSSGLGKRESAFPITFGSVQSVAPHLETFTQPISLLIIDECHRISLDENSQYAQIIAHLRKNNPKLMILGLTATPYRLSMGFCYKRHVWGMVRSDEDKPFDRCVYEVTLKQMVDSGYLVPPDLVDAPIAQYDFSQLASGESNKSASQDDSINQLLVRHKRVTRSIVEQIVQLTEQRARAGVMIFAATVDHAREILSYLPTRQAGLVVGATDNLERDNIIDSFRQRKLHYLVNVAVLTTGFDAPHVDFIAILRKTESVSLYQQIVGRGLRLCSGKIDCLVIDYAGNGYNLFSPEIGERKPHANSEMVRVTCPECNFENDFWGIVDGEGHVVEHYGRRCCAHQYETNTRCTYRFRFKECPHCSGENDIAARACAHCKKALIDPDDLLKDALRLKDAQVLRVSGSEFVVVGNKLTITYYDEDGAHLKEHFDFDHAAQRAVFNRVFSRRIASGRSPLELESAAQAVQLKSHLPRPDFVVARAQKIKGRPIWFKIQQRIFDYEGRYRTAASAN